MFEYFHELLYLKLIIEGLVFTQLSPHFYYTSNSLFLRIEHQSKTVNNALPSFDALYCARMERCLQQSRPH